MTAEKTYVTYEEFGAINRDHDTVTSAYAFSTDDTPIVIEDAHLPNPELLYRLFPDYDADFAVGKPYPYGTPKQVTAKGIRSRAGREILPFRRSEQYPSLAGLTLE